MRHWLSNDSEKKWKGLSCLSHTTIDRRREGLDILSLETLLLIKLIVIVGIDTRDLMFRARVR